MPDSKVVVEIKKERLTRHLDQVEELLSQWLGELFDPELFYRGGGSLSPKHTHHPLSNPVRERRRS